MVERFSLSRTGPDGETLYPVDGTLYIGSSSECHVHVKDGAPRQCQIVRSPDGYVLHDLTGMKVTKVNGARIDRHLLRPAEVVTVGSAELRWTVTEEPEEEVVLVEVAPTIRRRHSTGHVPIVKPAPEQKRPSILFLAGIGAAGLIVVIGLLIFVSTSSSNADRSISRRDSRPARSDIITLSSGAVRETVPVEPSAPRQNGVVLPAPEAPVRSADPSPIVIQPLPAVIPEMPSVKPAAPSKGEPRVRSPFEQRYASLLASLDKTLARGWGYEAMYKEILEASSAVVGPRGTAEHLKALAASLKDAVACRDCTTGKVGCEKCGGKGRVDLDCQTCQGQGRVRASGAVGDADVTVKCRNCDGKRIFRGVTCPACARAGKTVCATCRGNVWPVDRCPRPECNAGRTPCPTCSGAGVTMEKCPYCVKGRVRAPGAVGNADVTMKCRNCEIDGQHGTGSFRQDCKTCQKTGKVTCTHCGGPFNRSKPVDNRDKDKSVETGSRAVAAADGSDKPVEIRSKVMVSNKVYTVEKCGGCSASGCDRCLDLGWRIRPVSDPSRIIE